MLRWVWLGIWVLSGFLALAVWSHNTILAQPGKAWLFSPDHSETSKYQNVYIWGWQKWLGYMILLFFSARQKDIKNGSCKWSPCSFEAVLSVSWLLYKSKIATLCSYCLALDYHEFILHHMNVMITLQFIVITQIHVVNVLFADPEGGECKEYFESACTTRYIEKVCSLFSFLRKHSNLHFVFSRALEILSETLLVRDFQKFTWVSLLFVTDVTCSLQ